MVFDTLKQIFIPRPSTPKQVFDRFNGTCVSSVELSTFQVAQHINLNVFTNSSHQPYNEVIRRIQQQSQLDHPSKGITQPVNHYQITLLLRNFDHPNYQLTEGT